MNLQIRLRQIYFRKVSAIPQTKSVLKRTDTLCEQSTTDKAIFIALNNRDVHYEYNTVDETPIPTGFVALDGLQSVRLINFPAYVVISMFMLSVPYRIWLKSISSKQKIPIRRVVWKAWQIANA